MRLFAGAALATAALAAGAWAGYRLTTGIEWWLVESGAADALGWAIVAALGLTVFALPAAMWGLAARCWLVRVDPHQRLEATHRALMDRHTPEYDT